MSVVSCFLCSCDVSVGYMKTKRKRLSGSSVKRAVEILDNISTANYGRKISDLYDCNKEYDYICHKCQKKVEGLAELQMKIENERDYVITMVGKHFPHAGKKRTRNQTEAAEETSTSQLQSTTPSTPESNKDKRDAQLSVSAELYINNAQLLIHICLCSMYILYTIGESRLPIR